MSLVIGIDPDLVKSGVGVTRNGQLLELLNMDLFELMAFIDEHLESAHFVVEDVESMRPTFPRQLKGGNRTAQIAKISQNVGQVKAVARMICLYLDRQGAQFTKVKPLSGTAKAAKRKPELFKKLTAWQGRSNEDTRDAAMLALYGIRSFRS